MKGKIQLRGMKFYAYHGALMQETLVGGSFLVDLSFSLPHLKALTSDNLDDTINYASVYEIIKNEVNIPSRLLEHLAGRILNALKSHFPDISELRLKISKLNPPMEGEIDSACVVIED